MGTSLDDVLSGKEIEHVAEETTETKDPVVDNGEAQEPRTGDAQTQEAAEGAAQPAEAKGATPASEPSTMVPLKALEEERKGRQDWKEKAIRFEEELKHVRAQQSQPQTQQQQPVEMDFDTRLLNERMNMSEMMVRQQHQDVDEMLEVFQKAAKENPALGAHLAQQRHPWEWMYTQAKRMKAMEDIGSDPDAYRARVRAELEAEFKAASGAQTEQPAVGDVQNALAQTAAPKPQLPQSLATARSAAPRTAPAWTGPTSLNDILKR